MFPSIFIRPEMGLLPSLGAFLVLTFTLMIEKIRWVLACVVVLVVGIYSFQSSALMYVPSSPGSTPGVNCMAIGCPGSRWPMPRAPIFFPQMPPPWYSPIPMNPFPFNQPFPNFNFGLWPSMPCAFCSYGMNTHGGGYFTPYHPGRSIQSVDEKKGKKTPSQ